MPGYTLSDPSGNPISFDVPYNTGIDAINPEAVARAFQTQKIADAQKAVSAAIQFQGLRGYSQALKSGEPAEKALAKYGPMMFYQNPTAFGPAVRSVAPPAPMIRSAPRGEFVQIDPRTGSVKQLRAPTAPVEKPKTFNAAVGVDLLGRVSRLPMDEKQFKNFMAKAPDELKTNAVNVAISDMLPPKTNAPASTNRTALKILSIRRRE